MFNTLRIFIIVLILPCVGYTQSQSVQFFPAFDIDADPANKVQLIGKLGNFYYIYHSTPMTSPELLTVNEKAEIIQTKPLSFIEPGIANGVNILLLKNSMHFVVQELRGNKHYVKIEAISADGNLLKEPTYIDSTDYGQYGQYSFYKLVASPNTKHVLLYRVVQGFSSIQILFNGILLDENGNKKESGFFYLPFSSDRETIGNVFLTNDGKVILPIHDKYDNYKLGTTLKLYLSNLQKDPPQLIDFYLKEKKPVELLIDWDKKGNRLALAGLYNNFYSKTMEGAMTLLVNLDKKTLDTVIDIPLDKAFKKQLRHRIFGIPHKEIINSLRIRFFEMSEDGQVHLLTDLFTNAALYSKQFPAVPLMGDQASNNYRPNNFRSVGTVNNLSEKDFSNYINLGASAAAPGSLRYINSTNGNQTTATTGTRTSGATLANGRPNMDRNFSRNQNSILNNNSGSYNRMPVLYDASNLAASSKMLNYKSVYFSTDSSRKISSRGSAQQFYVPGTEFSNIIIQPMKTGLGLINYELSSKNHPVLTRHQFNPNGNVSKTAIADVSDPLLFYKGNAVIVDGDKILTMYVDPHSNKLGLALIH